MKNNEISFDEIKLYSLKVFEDNRGFFYESFNHEIFNKKTNLKVNFVQDNISYSKKGVIRGLHFQREPSPQGKMISVINGQIFDVAVDIRVNSPTFGKYCSFLISDASRSNLWIPEGFAHGFQVLSDFATVIYKVNNFYDKNNEVSIHYDDKDIGIRWPLDAKIISEKDKLGVTLKEVKAIA